MILGPLPAVLLSLVSPLVVHVARYRGASFSRVGLLLIARAAALAVSIGVLVLPFVDSQSVFTKMAVPAVFLAVDLLVSQAFVAARSGRPFGRSLVGTVGAQAPLLAAQWSAAVLLLMTYGGMSSWSLIPVVALLLLTQQSYALFLDIRESYRTTVEVLVEAAESQDARRVGHADRTAQIARSIASNMGLPAAEVERVSYASLLHDLGVLAADPDPEATGDVQVARASEVVHGVAVFESVEPVLQACEGTPPETPFTNDVLLIAMIVALASDIDGATTPAVAEAHHGSATEAVAGIVPAAIKARVVGAAVGLGYPIPAVN
jgi:hypothetical protein